MRVDGGEREGGAGAYRRLLTSQVREAASVCCVCNVLFTVVHSTGPGVQNEASLEN